MLQLQITREGGVQMLQDDKVDLRELGSVEMIRASHVEFDNAKQGWFVQSAKTMTVLAEGFASRAEALTWEKIYYSPSGAGWAELTEKQKGEKA